MPFSYSIHDIYHINSKPTTSTRSPPINLSVFASHLTISRIRTNRSCGKTGFSVSERRSCSLCVSKTKAVAAASISAILILGPQMLPRYASTTLTSCKLGRCVLHTILAISDGFKNAVCPRWIVQRLEREVDELECDRGRMDCERIGFWPDGKAKFVSLR